MNQRWHVLVGSSAERDFLDQAEDRVTWYVPKGCKVGDGVVFLAPSFEGDFMAVGRIATRPVPDQDRKGYYLAEVGDFRRIRPVAVAEAREHLPDWKFLSYARSYTTVAPAFERRLLALLGAEQAAPTPVEAGHHRLAGAPHLTLFSWGYEGWGNWTEQLVNCVDAVEASRGWGPPVFVDVRASRSVRAVGFRDKAFQQRFGPDRYRWLKGLGNAAIVDKGYGLIDPARDAELLALALELTAEQRRVIFFCSCVSPTAGCHRHWITPELLASAKSRGQAVTVVEWPGFESDSGMLESVEIDATRARGLGDQRKSLPLGTDLPSVDQLARPWFTPVKVVTGSSSPGYVLTGPAQHRAGAWILPILSSVVSWPMVLKLQRFYRRTDQAAPSHWPPDQSRQSPFVWGWGGPMKSEVQLRQGDSLARALEDLADGGLVKLGPGTFRVDAVRILQPFRLQGSGMDATEIVSAVSGAALYFEGDDSWEVQDLTVRHEGEAPACCLLALAGTLQVSRCRFVGAVSTEDGEWGSGVLAGGTTHVTVTDCQALRCDCGVELSDQAVGTVRDNVCQECEIGILVSGASTPLVERNRCQRNEIGINYRGEAAGLCRGNECTDCENEGILVEEEAVPALEGNHVEAPVER